MPDGASRAIELFHPLIRRWFGERVGTPTEIQELAWPAIARGEHVLATAPTGSGKTLCAFLWSLQKLLTGEWPSGATRVLYVSPLKALNTDIRLNLLEPLRALRELFAAEAGGAAVPDIQVHTRSGDTPPEERRRTLKRPPEILITTPESLNILLTSASGEMLLHGLTTVILDEVHAVAGSKRGTHLFSAVERLARLCGEPQRIALSATVKPLSTVAELVGGYRPIGAAAEGAYRKRAVSILSSRAAKRYELSVRVAPPLPPGSSLPPDGSSADGLNPVWPPIAAELRRIIASNRSTLVFTNSRRLAEKIAFLVNEGQERQIAYAHHGSLSREVRTEVERKLKAGELDAIVATSSLELGIDVGALDEVILVQTPFGVASTLQRVGRAAHSVGRVSRGSIYPTHGMDFVAAAVTARAALDGDIEETHPVRCPLDVLAQLIVSMTTREQWRLDELYGFIRSVASYHELKREHFDLVVEMLAGRYADARIRALSPLVSVDRIDGTIVAREGAARLIYSSGGTIPDRGYYTLRTADTKARLGELDEEFVWERSLGDRFMLGTQAWRIEKIDFQNVEVLPAPLKAGMAPFWKAENMDRPFPLAERMALELERWNAMLDEPGGESRLTRDLTERCSMEGEAAARLVGFIEQQRTATRCATPHRHHLVVERSVGPLGEGQSHETILHTLWGGRVNRPVAMALAEAWRDRHGTRIECFADNDGILIMAPIETGLEDLLGLLDPERFRALLRRSLESSGVFGARFRENAARALLLPSNAKRRMPLWVNRQRSKKLMDAVMRTPDFPILLETWRSCLEDDLDPDAALLVLDELRTGAIRVTETKTRVPSPFCESLIWRQTTKYLYQGDEQEKGEVSSLSDDLIREFISGSRPELAVPTELIARLERKLRRTERGYAPDSPRRLLDWVVERLAIPHDEWQELLAAIREDGAAPEQWIGELGDKIVTLTLPGAAIGIVTARELLQRVERSFGSGEADAEAQASFLAEWVRFSGPFGVGRLRQVFGLSPQSAEGLVDAMRESHQIVYDVLRAGSGEPELCDAENLEALLRMRRAAARPAIEPLPASSIPLFLAAHQGLCRRGSDLDGLKSALDRLFGFPAPAELWEQEILPARLAAYHPAWLDSLLGSSGLRWLGCGKQRTTFAFAEDLELFEGPGSGGGETELDDLFPDRRGRYSFWDLLERAGGRSSALTARLWELVWKGLATNDSYETLRRGLRTRFTADEPIDERRGRMTRIARSRWQSSRPATGSWFLLPPRAPEGRDSVEAEELGKDRARQLLDRYGILFRELCAQELAPLRWAPLFRTLRLMELAGEIVSGLFFTGLPGPQFASFAAVRELEQGLPDDAVYWMSAMDPASPCGRRIEGLGDELPARVRGTHLVYEGSTLRMVSRRSGEELRVYALPDHPRLPEILSVLREMVGRQVDPLNSVTVERVNGEPAAASPYAPALLAAGFTRDYRRLVLRARY